MLSIGIIAIVPMGIALASSLSKLDLRYNVDRGVAKSPVYDQSAAAAAAAAEILNATIESIVQKNLEHYQKTTQPTTNDSRIVSILTSYLVSLSVCFLFFIRFIPYLIRECQNVYASRISRKYSFELRSINIEAFDVWYDELRQQNLIQQYIDVVDFEIPKRTLLKVTSPVPANLRNPPILHSSVLADQFQYYMLLQSWCKQFKREEKARSHRETLLRSFNLSHQPIISSEPASCSKSRVDIQLASPTIMGDIATDRF
jgi:hypothetical protein